MQCARKKTKGDIVGHILEEHIYPHGDASIDKKDLAWFLMRLGKQNLLSVEDNHSWKGQNTTGWTAFNVQMSSMNVPRTTIGYCPMIASSPTEFSTVYTFLKNVQTMTESLGQSNSFITFDLALYTKAKEIRRNSSTLLYKWEVFILP